VLVGKEFWGPLIDFMRERLIARQTIDPADLERVFLTDSAQEAVEHVAERAIPQFGLTYGPRPKWYLGEK
jgi:predicted Rossmann-fold nucleotide-binding protein